MNRNRYTWKAGEPPDSPSPARVRHRRERPTGAESWANSALQESPVGVAVVRRQLPSGHRTAQNGGRVCCVGARMRDAWELGEGGRSLSGFVGNNSRPRLPIESPNLPRLRSTAGQRMKQAACPEWTGQAALHWIRANSFRRLQAGERTSLHSGREKRRDRSITWSHRDIPEIRKPELRPQRDTASAINRSHLNQSIHSTPLLFPSQIRREQGMVRTNSVCG